MFNSIGFYRDTIDPFLPYRRLLTDGRVYASILIHSLLYTVSIYVVGNLLFQAKIPLFIFVRILAALVIIMWIGYPLRLWRAKNIFKYYKDIRKTNEMMDSAYFCWYFLG